jgi:hypothetical protein
MNNECNASVLRIVESALRRYLYGRYFAALPLDLIRRVSSINSGLSVKIVSIFFNSSSTGIIFKISLKVWSKIESCVIFNLCILVPFCQAVNVLYA